ncbi:MAG: molybdenum cofactor biosynthesis protein MoaE [Myxococcales bacterium]|nr:molybdenum cofactor biosynthesis protein MoaE [Myxococcales bacterium]
MTVRVLLFAGLRERLRRDHVDLELRDGASVGELLAALASSYPAAAPLLPPCRVAVDHTFVAADHAVPAGAEVAIIPPVSGGHDHDDRFYLGGAPLVQSRVVAAVERRAAGGVVTFIGKVREHSHGQRIHHLEYEAYEPMALRVMREIADAVEVEVPGAQLAIHHRLGWLGIGEVAVVLAAAAPHRAEAFDACRAAIDRLKRDVPIWKREVAVDGTTWFGQGP